MHRHTTLLLERLTGPRLLSVLSDALGGCCSLLASIVKRDAFSVHCTAHGI